jgi:phosphate/sulfate permease
MELTLIYTIVGFGLAGWSVIGNDSIQTLGTFIASKEKWFKWYILAGAASAAMVVTITYGWWKYAGDISYGRLTRIPYQEIQWYHAVAPGILLLLTRIGIPVSTTFLVLSAFASTVVLEKMLIKSVVGYGLAATTAYICWIVISKFINEKFDEITEQWKITFWRNSVWFTSAFLWATWLMHDVANIAVYLPRQLSVIQLSTVIIYFTILLFYIFKIHGGPIQKVVLDKTGTRYARSATIINIIYAGVLYYFKELNDLPMSTTWVFVGLLCGRELAISTMNKDYKFKYVFPLIGKDFVKMIFGLSVSVAIVLAIHYIIIPNGFF